MGCGIGGTVMKKMICFMFLIRLFSFLGVSAAAQDNREIALVIKVVGSVEIKSVEDKWRPVKVGQRLNSGDFLRTGEEALVAIVFTDDKSMIKIRSSSQFQLEGERRKEGITKRLLITVGQVWIKIFPRGSGFRMVTPSGVAAVRGTEFYAYVADLGRTTIFGIEGEVELYNYQGKVSVTEGKMGEIKRDEAPTISDAVTVNRWAEDDDTSQSLEIEFMDDQGKLKTFKLRYEEGK
ncbi:MAG: hypothetical protein EHM72_06805 [Calditrichaeota bacterium]|nr:MAG: hypothetical protein EHM72_06805 [Calditrichota bacterium]